MNCEYGVLIIKFLLNFLLYFIGSLEFGTGWTGAVRWFGPDSGPKLLLRRSKNPDKFVRCNKTAILVI